MKFIWIMIFIFGFLSRHSMAELTKMQFVEAISVLKLDPATLATAGVSDSDLTPIWGRVRESDMEWQAYDSRKSNLRMLLNRFEDTEEYQIELLQARQMYADAIEDWRIALFQTVSDPELRNLNIMSSQGTSDFPIYLKVVDWSPEEAALIERGFSESLHSPHHQIGNHNAELDFYSSALARNEVVLAKLRLEEKGMVYRLVFSDYLESF